MQNANESMDLRSVRRRLDALKIEVSSVVAHEKALIKNRAERLAVLRREMTQREENERETANRRIQELGQLKREMLDSEQLSRVTRSERIQQAYHSSRAALAQRVQQVKDGRLGRAQGEMMRNRQTRNKEMELAAKAHQELLGFLLVDRNTRRDLTKDFLAAWRSYRALIGNRLNEIHKIDWESTESPESLRGRLGEEILRIVEILAEAKRLPLPRFFRWVPLWLIFSLEVGMHLWFAFRPSGAGLDAVLPSLGISTGILLVIWGLGFASLSKTLRQASSSLSRVKSLLSLAEKKSAERVTDLTVKFQREQAEEEASLGQTFRESESDWQARITAGQKKLEQQIARISQGLERLHARRLLKITAAHEHALLEAQAEVERRQQVTALDWDRANAVIESEVRAKIHELKKPWLEEVCPRYDALASLESRSLYQFPAWTSANCGNWDSPAESSPLIRLGKVRLDLGEWAGGLPYDAQLALPGAAQIDLPLCLSFPDQGSLLIETNGREEYATARVLNSMVLRLLSSSPAGRASFVFIDPVGLGKDFAGLMHLADYEESIIHHRIWTQSSQIEERLAELNEHIEKVIQMYLRNEYANLIEYNKQAGSIAEKSHFLVIAGFPSAFSETACQRLLSIATSGARCGVHLLIHRDLRQPLLNASLEEELRRTCVRVELSENGFRLADSPAGLLSVTFDSLPEPEAATVLVHRIGKASIDSNRVQVPFSQISPTENEWWSLDSSEELRVTIGRTGAKKLQMLAIGKGTRQHMLVAGKTGSGKSTLFHVIITNLVQWFSPQQVEFYLIDFKKGVEFKCYASKQLPHARVIAIESDREFALSVLRRLDGELKRRGELFRCAGSQDLAGYKRSEGATVMPRSLLLIDEFQEFFTEDDAVAQEASLLLDRIVRQGRAFGIHVILGSQTLGGAYTLARATLGQMVIRVALQCNEADAHLIMEDDNPAPRMLTRPGEGIYNDQAGAFAANSPFQIVWLPEEERDAVLDKVRCYASLDEAPVAVPIIFEGNAPADIREQSDLKKLLRSQPVDRPMKVRAWLGAPNSIKGPTEAVFQRQSGSHLLVVGQSRERGLSMLGLCLVGLAAQYPRDQVKFVVLDPYAEELGDQGFFQRLSAIFPHSIQIGTSSEVSSLLSELSADMANRIASSDHEAPELFLIVHDLQRFKALRPSDDFMFSMDDSGSSELPPSQIFTDLLSEGGPLGMHVLASTDTWNHVSRWIPRKLLAEFEMRVLFQMSANDSSNLIDSPAATSLGLHRALFYHDRDGTLETFRPYAMPDEAWFADIGKT